MSSELERDLRQMKADFKAVSEEREGLEKEITRLKATVTGHEWTIDNMRTERNVHLEEIAVLEGELDDEKRRGDRLLTELTDYQKRLASAEIYIEQLTVLLKAKRKELEGLKEGRNPKPIVETKKTRKTLERKSWTRTH